MVRQQGPQGRLPTPGGVAQRLDRGPMTSARPARIIQAWISHCSSSASSSAWCSPDTAHLEPRHPRRRRAGGHGPLVRGDQPPSRPAARAGRRHAKLVGGALLALGLLTPLGAALLIAVMVTAIVTVRMRNGIWAADGGFEYELVLIAAAFALADAGPGDWSLDPGPGDRLVLDRLGTGRAGCRPHRRAGRRDDRPRDPGAEAREAPPHAA